VAFGLIASIVMIGLSPPIWPGPDSQGSPSPLTFPGLVTIPIGFLGCWLGTVLSREREGERSFDELKVRSETGLGSEAGGTPRRARRARRAREGGAAETPSLTA
jgi:cation/acetate symporter